MDQTNDNQIDLDKLILMMAGNEVTKIYFKLLSPNDNSKNQVYVGPDVTSISMIPTGDFKVTPTTSLKQSVRHDSVKLHAPMTLYWMSHDGNLCLAPYAQLILYPQYPEVRFSGFLQGCDMAPSTLMNPTKRGRDEGRVLFIGIRDGGAVVSYLASPESIAAEQARGLDSHAPCGVFIEILIQDAGFGRTSRSALLSELKRISEKGWITGKKLRADRTIAPCNNPNCGGYTLEAELGITPNSKAEPDFLGWEVKQFGVASFEKTDTKVITLMTPEPTGGFYKEEGVEAFIRKYGYPDRRGRPDRLNFGGIHKVGLTHKLTNLKLVLDGFDPSSKKISDGYGGITLVAEDGSPAAIWHYEKLINHWKRKHGQAVYIPSLSHKNKVRKYQYGKWVKLGSGADFRNLLTAISIGEVYYDPGIKLENESGNHPKTKRRSQFRIKSGNLGSLYERFEIVHV